MEVYGNRKDVLNPFHWDHMEFNLPGSKGYRSDLPWVMKIRINGFLAANFFVYVANGRVVAYSSELAWRAARAYAACCSGFGIQDASRKRTSALRTPGSWAGIVTHTDENQVCGMVSKEKWEKTQWLVRELATMLEQEFLPLHCLLVIRGFLNYVVHRYTWLNPYIKGLHLTINSWKPGREMSGFKLKEMDLERAMAAWAESRGTPCRRVADGLEEDLPLRMEEAPVEVRAVPRLQRDVACLLDLTGSRHPRRQLYRAVLSGKRSKD
jgi:hypothetical protein